MEGDPIVSTTASSLCSLLVVRENEEMTSHLRQKFQSLTVSSRSEDAKDGELTSENREEMERTRIQTMKALILKQDPSAKDVDDLMIRRFLRARDLDVDKASAMFLKYLKWRREAIPNGFISPSEISNDLAQNKLFMQGYDRAGRPIVVIFPARHKPASTTVEEFKRFNIYGLEKICARMPSGHEKFTSIADVQGWGYVNSDIRGYLAALSILQDCYPEGKLLIINAPYIFVAVWKMVYPFIDKNTKKKIVFAEDNKLRATLLEDIDDNQLPECVGGPLKLVPIQEC
ncbi:phosphatidylinositol transfer protein 3-like [Salvia splendens]|uniref:phosphatidylinositol transfer protein 3-like n=1 Tax=Salvia splendens TaxID=180675 RepID=UPI001C25A9D7|nr:phosphatidylinositol transfer protein 3-like [Salvia splendens]